MESCTSTGDITSAMKQFRTRRELTLRQKAEQFRILKENFSSTGKYEDEDEAYIMFKRYEAKSWLTEQQEKGGIAKIAVIFLMDFNGWCLTKSAFMPPPLEESC